MSSPANQPVEDSGGDGGSLDRLMADPMRAAVVTHLLEEGEASTDELRDIASRAVATDEPTDHDRFRASIALTVDHLPVLVEHDIVTVDESNSTVAVGFLPTDTIKRLRSALE